MSYNPNNPNGQATMANSAPVVVASDQTAVKVDGSAVTQPVSGTVTVQQTTASSLKVDLSGTAANTTAVKTDSSAVTQPVSAAVLPLPSGASTAAKQPALGTAGSASSDVLSVQGIASMTALKVDGSAVTQPVSATSLPLPAGAATAAKQPALGTAGSASADVLSVQGVTSMTALKVDGSGVTQPVSGTFWQATQPVSGTVTANVGTTNGLALDATLTGGNAEVQGNVAAGATDAGNPVKAGGKYVSTPPSLTTGQRGDLSLDQRGSLRVNLTFTDTTTPVPPLGDNVDGAAPSGSANKLAVQSRTTLFNGTNWDREYSNWSTTTGDTGAKTATFNGATQTNFNHGGATVVFNIGTVSGTSPTLVAKIQGSADGGTTFYDIPGAATASITASSVVALTVYPGTTVAANAALSYPLPRTWRVVYTIGGTSPSFTLTNVQVAYIL